MDVLPVVTTKNAIPGNTRFLIIGVGGVGVRVVSGFPYTSELPVGFLAIDSDRSSLDKARGIAHIYIPVAISTTDPGNSEPQNWLEEYVSPAISEKLKTIAHHSTVEMVFVVMGIGKFTGTVVGSFLVKHLLDKYFPGVLKVVLPVLPFSWEGMQVVKRGIDALFRLLSENTLVVPVNPALLWDQYSRDVSKFEKALDELVRDIITLVVKARDLTTRPLSPTDLRDLCMYSRVENEAVFFKPVAFKFDAGTGGEEEIFNKNLHKISEIELVKEVPVLSIVLWRQGVTFETRYINQIVNTFRAQNNPLKLIFGSSSGLNGSEIQSIFLLPVKADFILSSYAKQEFASTASETKTTKSAITSDHTEMQPQSDSRVTDDVTTLKEKPAVLRRRKGFQRTLLPPEDVSLP